MPIHLKAGQDLPTLQANVLLLKAAGWTKDRAVAAVLGLAGFSYPDSPTTTKSSSDVQ